jgi:hypothetical protein
MTHQCADGLRPNLALGGIVVGRIESLASPWAPRVSIDGLVPDGADVLARTTLSLTKDDVGSEVALMFEGGDLERAIVLGRILQSIRVLKPDGVLIDGQSRKVELTGEHEIVLRCGQASITLTRAGKIILRGTYISSRSSGVNRIKGGSVQIN